MKSRDTCYRILQAESEREVAEIVESVPELGRAENWHPIDGRETNFNVVTNQAATGGKALTELCTNMVDAVLLKHAYLKGIDPTGPDAPQSVISGVRDLVRLPGVHSGILFEADSGSDKGMQEFAEKNLVIGVTGGKPRKGEPLCITFVDNGEGQQPEDFEVTFLSLSSGRKSAIPFVQGKYNMGSSGVLGYCGRRWYKLILSRRFDSSGKWGWTLVRRKPGGGMPVAQYYRPQRGAIPSFSASVIHPLCRADGQLDQKVHISTGTIVKLYDYTMESGVSFRHIREALNENLVSTVLPFRLMDYRQTPDPRRKGRRALGIDERPVNGMEFLLLRSVRSTRATDTSDEEESYKPGTERHIGDDRHPLLGSVSVRAIVPVKQAEGRPHLPGWLAPTRNPNRIFHAVNGQVQFKQTRGFLSTKCKLPGLKDRVVIVVDASELSESAHNDVWKGDRETIRATPIGQLYQERVAELIKGSDYLKELQKRVAREETKDLADESQRELFQNLVKDDPSIAQLLPGGQIVRLRGDIGRGTKKTEPWQGRYSPTFLDVTGKEAKREGARVPLRGERSVTFETDAENEYLKRPANKGRFWVAGPRHDDFAYTASLRDGRLRVRFQAVGDQMVVGHEYLLKASLQDDAMAKPVTATLKLLVVPEKRTAPPKPPKPPSPRKPARPPDQPGSEEDDVQGEARGLPQTQWLTRDGRTIGDKETVRWPPNFHDQDGGEVRELEEGRSIYRINYDNAHFRRVLDAVRGEADKRVVAEQYRIGMLVLMLGLEDALARMTPEEGKKGLEEHVDTVRRLAARGAATVVMSITRTVSKIVNPATVGDPDDA